MQAFKTKADETKKKKTGASKATEKKKENAHENEKKKKRSRPSDHCYKDGEGRKGNLRKSRLLIARKRYS